MGGAFSLQSESDESEGLKPAADGTYLIYTADDLKEFADIVNGIADTPADKDANAKLMNDIDLNGSEENPWIPIGTSINNPYEGNFNGDGHTISGLYIAGDDDDQGLFGYVSGTVQNLSVSGSIAGDKHVGGVVGLNSGIVENCYNIGKVSGVGSVGGVVGWNDSGTVKNCYNTGAVNSSGSSVGGVVGQNIGGIVENCYNTGEVSGNSSVGGVVGLNDGKVTGCYNTGKVSGNSYVGGVVGYNDGTVENCYNTGTVSGSYVGGVVGENSGGSVTNCYNTGTVSGSYVGGVVGYNSDSGNVTGCYFLKDTAGSGIGSGKPSEENVKSLTAEEFADQSKLSSWTDFASTWSIHPVLGRPVLNENKEGGLGTEASPYEISTADQLKNFAVAVNTGSEQSAHAKLMNNIDLKDVCGLALNGGQSVSWTPIGNDAHQYIGTFDGNGHTISGLYIDSSTAGYQGLFGYVGSEGTVQNLAVSGSVSGHWYVGGVVGYNNGGTVTGCTFSVSGNVSGDWHVGGVVGYNNGGTVTGCIFSGSGSVSGLDSVGGVAGLNHGSVKNCYNTGKVSGGAGVGGVVGQNVGGTVENCYNTVSVSGDWYVGGVVGRSDGSVKNCTNTGSVNVNGSAASSNVGGVVGQNFGGTVENCYNTGEVSGDWYVGGVVGDNRSIGNVTNCYFLQTDDVNENLPGIGNGSGDAAEKDDTAFHSGEVAWRLQKGQTAGEGGVVPLVWGQSNLKDKNSWPTLVALDNSAQPVYQVTFDYGTSFTDIDERFAYSYTNGVVSKPDKNPELDGHTLSGWYSDESLTTEWNFDTEISNDTTLYAKWTPVAEPDPEPTPTPDPTPSGPSTGDSTGWDDIRDELENAENGDEITIDMGDETKVPAEIFESLAGKDVDVTFDLGDIQWSVNGADIPTDTDFTDLDLGASLDTHGIPVNVINTITGERGTVQMTLAHDGEFGFTMTLTAPLGKENAGYWANLYHYDEDAEALNFEAAAKIDEDGNVTIPFSHASQYAIVIDDHSHAAVDVSDLFIDIAPDAWYKDAVQYAYDNGLMTGVSDTEFAPEATTTRAMIVSILARLEGVTTAQAAGFADVDDNDWYATAVNWAANVGVVNGYEDNTFKPNTAITREQLAAILMNYAAYKGEDVSNRADLTSYTDQPSTWAEEAISWSVAEGLLTGVTADTLQPQGAATRAQVAAILQRYLEA